MNFCPRANIGCSGINFADVNVYSSASVISVETKSGNSPTINNAELMMTFLTISMTTSRRIEKTT